MFKQKSFRTKNSKKYSRLRTQKIIFYFIRDFFCTEIIRYCMKQAKGIFSFYWLIARFGIERPVSLSGEPFQHMAEVGKTAHPGANCPPPPNFLLFYTLKFEKTGVGNRRPEAAILCTLFLEHNFHSKTSNKKGNFQIIIFPKTFFL